MRDNEAGYLVLSRALFTWGSAGGLAIAILATAVWVNGVRPDAAELRGLALLIAFEICALSICAGMLVRVIGDARRRIATSHTSLGERTQAQASAF